ncbi:hypothetical protein BUALT_Bualt17G0073100 [Buddleja alternifolia]|uniref:Arabinanase/levansucrase/invertase n=1 Tax=Buddleja alternifolia TaxID=168488 RepID=A0AAV6W6T7_9LAMI|nr:hypothetical protein BUALT_Bualt17G0073100 [Buddleja alternifolia]
METTASINIQPRPTHNLTTFTSKWPQINPKSLNFTSSRNKIIPFSPTHCSTKPNTNKQNSTNENHSNPKSPPNSETLIQPTPISAQKISNSSFSRGLIFDLGPINSWDSLEIGSPVVKRFIGDEEERWYMWYHGRSIQNPNSDSIGLAVSSNGVHWERGLGGVKSNSDVGLVMNCSNDWWAFDTHSVRPCEVVIMSSSKVRANSAVYWLYYTGFCSEKLAVENVELGVGNGDLMSLPGLAMSQDGRHWARIEGEHHSGALLDVGSEGEWDSLFISSPQVVFHGVGDLRMYYHSYDVEKGHFSIGIARSRDGMRWIKLGKVLGGGQNGAFDERGIVNARVLRNRRDGKYLMVYEGVGGDRRRGIGMAVSSDGLRDWRRRSDGPVLEQSRAGGWDCEGVGLPCLVQMDGDVDEWRLYYRGIGEGGRSGIGLAVSQGSEVNNFQRWSGFHL